MATATCKGVLLNFEDAAGKVWRFRYSYWNSSQSYVLTKGWSRFVKEKSLKAGDVITFHRSTGPEKQLFIDYKPRSASAAAAAAGPVEPDRPARVVRLFGVNLVGIPGEGEGRGLGQCGGEKRRRAVDMLTSSAQMFKKRFVEAYEL